LEGPAEREEFGQPRKESGMISLTKGEEPTFWVSEVVLFKEEKVKKINSGQRGNPGRH
jgi:hypothetical protein